MLGHENQGTARAFKIGRKQGQHQPICWVAVKLLEAVDRVFFIKIKVTDVVATRGFTGGAAAGEGGLLLPVARFYCIVFEELDGQERDLGDGFDILNIHVQQSEVAPVQGVVSCLKTEDFQRQLLEANS